MEVEIKKIPAFRVSGMKKELNIVSGQIPLLWKNFRSSLISIGFHDLKTFVSI